MGVLRSMKREAGRQQEDKASNVPQAMSDAAGSEVANSQGSNEEIPPALKKAMDDFETILMKIIHAPETRDDIMGMLEVGSPEEAIKGTALQVFSMAEQALTKKTGQPLDQNVKLAGGVYLVADLVELGKAGLGWEVTPEQTGYYIELVMGEYVRRGLADGSIDPIQLQKDTEPLMNQAQRDVGVTIQNELGMPDEPTAQMGMDRIKQDAQKPLEKENKKLKGQLMASSQGQPQGQPQQPQGQPQQPQGV